MPNSNNKDREPCNINFCASHDQASVQDESASNHKKLNGIKSKLEKIQENLQSESETHSPKKSQQQLNEMNETKTEVINLVTYARQIVHDLQENAKKLSTIHLHPSEEKLENAKLLLPTLEPLTGNEKYRFKKIEEAISNTCIIKSAGDETIKFQLGILGDAKDNNIISKSEFDYLIVARLKYNNLLDSYRLRAEGDMILEQTPLEICQAINKDLSSDVDYEASKKIFMARLKGIDFELSSQNCKSPRGVTQLQKELESLSQNFQADSGQPLFLPEVVSTPIEFNPQQPSNAALIKETNHSVEHTQRSEFVAIMEELIPANKKNEIQIDPITPIPVEKIMKITLQRPSPLSENKKRDLNYSMVLQAVVITGNAAAKVQEDIKCPSGANNGYYTYKEMMERLGTLKERHAEQLQETTPCQLTGKPLVEEYYAFGKKYLKEKIQKYETAINNLKEAKRGKYGDFSRQNSKHSNLKKDQTKQNLNQLYEQKIAPLKTGIEKTEKQQALWEGHETFTQNQELDFRNRAFNSAPEGKTINVYLDGVHLVTDKKAEPSKITQISNTRAPHKSCITGLTSSSANFYKEHNTKEKNPKQTVGMALGS